MGMAYGLIQAACMLQCKPKMIDHWCWGNLAKGEWSFVPCCRLDHEQVPVAQNNHRITFAISFGANNSTLR